MAGKRENAKQARLQDEIRNMQQKISDIINNDYTEDKREIVTGYLSTINLTHVMAESEYNLNNTLLSILLLANGDADEVAKLTERAKIDFRDVIYWATLQKK